MQKRKLGKNGLEVSAIGFGAMGMSQSYGPPGRALVIANTSSGSEELAKKVPKAHVISAFNTVPSEVLFSVFERAGRGKREAGSGVRPSVVYCGDNTEAKKVAAQLISDVGFEPIDAGPLRIARYAEPFTMLVGQLAYEGSRGPALAYRFEWLEEREA